MLSPRKLAWIEAKTRLIKTINRILFLCLAASFGLVIVSHAIPQKKAYEALQAKLKTIQEREQEVLAQKENHSIELKALREDSTYLEVQARDRLNYYREGERVLRFPRNP